MKIFWLKKVSIRLVSFMEMLNKPAQEFMILNDVNPLITSSILDIEAKKVGFSGMLSLIQKIAFYRSNIVRSL